MAGGAGRLEVMGGIADYRGAGVLELPLACSTSAAVQAQQERRCDIVSRRDGRWDFFSIELPLPEPATLARWFRDRPRERWASYVVGVVQAVLRRSSANGGLRIPYDSTLSPR